jgi:glycerophosphoryl diester phosphodiesterase
MELILHRAQDKEPQRWARLGYNAAEIDVMMTRDKVIVVRHDHIYDGLPVWEQDYVPDMGMRLENAYFDGVPLFIEVKLPESHPDMDELASRLLDELVLHFNPRIVILSFSANFLHRLYFKHGEQDIPLVYVDDGRRPVIPYEEMEKFLRGIAFPAQHIGVHSGAHNLPLFPYGTAEEIKKYIPPTAHIGIAGVITS